MNKLAKTTVQKQLPLVQHENKYRISKSILFKWQRITRMEDIYKKAAEWHFLIVLILGLNIF